MRDLYASPLLSGGEKAWEIRGRPTRIRGPVFIVKQGTGQAFGTVDLVRVLGPLDLDYLLAAPELPVTECAKFRRTGLPYDRTYACVCIGPRLFDRPVSSAPKGPLRGCVHPGLLSVTGS